MAGRIRDDDIALVRERSPIAEVIGQVVTLRSAGGGNLKGLCPFHDEKTPSFSVSPDKGFYYCFGCGAHGDLIKFVQDTEHLSFVEAVESLARRAGVELRYEQGGATPGRERGQRQRLLDAHQQAAEFYQEQLTSPEAEIGRQFLKERGFDEVAAARFGVGYAPAGWDHLVRYLRPKGFSDKELLVSGLASEGQRGPIDRFRGRLVWPIRDIKGDVIGFGARRLRDDDNGPKYLNTPETPLYKKSHVLYGIDLAKAEIARSMQAVVVEGYTDVMACHLAGIGTAVATCGTSFGIDHIGVLRRLLMDQDELRGRVIFTFDGDEAGQKAALRSFADDQRFVTQTFVSVEPNGMDPCELRMAKGDAAVRDLVAGHQPLVEFAIRSVLSRHDLDTAEGRVAALHAAAPLVAKIKDVALRDEYARRLAGWLGLATEVDVLGRVRQLSGAGAGAARRTPSQRTARPDPRDPRLEVEREVCKLALQAPGLAGPVFDTLDAECFTAAAYGAVAAAVAAAGGTSSATGGQDWVSRVRDVAPDESLGGLVVELAVEPLRMNESGDSGQLARYATSHLARLQEMALTRRISELSSRLQRINPVEQAEEHNKLFGQLIALEQYKRGLREQAIGAL